MMISLLSSLLLSCRFEPESAKEQVTLLNGFDSSAGGLPAYIVTTNNATYFLEKTGGGLSSLLDVQGVDWLGFHNKPGSGWKGEYRGFPNAIHKQDGDYFHAMNSGTDLSTSVVEIESPQHIRIVFTSANGKWHGQWDFYPERCDFTMRQVSSGHQYWIQYEGVPGGTMDATDFWISSADEKKHSINTPFLDDLPAPEWIAFGDENSPRMLYLLHHQDDNYPDNYVSRPDMTVFGFGRSDKNKYLKTPQSFSLGFVESTEYKNIENTILKIPLYP
ncbi:hypothetical protein [Paraglaciecola sp.]|uniref:hypothetical protein n=1 Tax=Paraglaciecola sp. TaxID=1920173 RepID=UPI003EF7037E